MRWDKQSPDTWAGLTHEQRRANAFWRQTAEVLEPGSDWPLPVLLQASPAWTVCILQTWRNQGIPLAAWSRFKHLLFTKEVRRSKVDNMTRIRWNAFHACGDAHNCTSIDIAERAWQAYFSFRDASIFSNLTRFMWTFTDLPLVGGFIDTAWTSFLPGQERD